MIKLPFQNLTENFIWYANSCLTEKYVLDNQSTEGVETVLKTIKEGKKGVLILGNPGSGKTFIMDCLQKIIPLDENGFLKVNVLDVVLEFNLGGHKIFNLRSKHNVFYDDLGTEDKGKFYSEYVEVFEKFIQFRYELWRSKGIITHFTSNDTAAELFKRYGLRCKSRLQEMFDIVVIGGNQNYEDRRTRNNFIGYPSIYHPQKQKKTEMELTEKEIENIMIQGAREKFETFKKNGIVSDPGNSSYKYLTYKKLINISIQRKNELMWEGQQTLIFDAEKRKALNFNKEIERGIDEFIEQIQGNDQDFRIKAKAMEIALNNFFRELVEQDKTLEI